MSFTKTIGGYDPWHMPSDGDTKGYVVLRRGVKRKERNHYARAARRQAKKEIIDNLTEA